MRARSCSSSWCCNYRLSVTTQPGLLPLKCRPTPGVLQRGSSGHREWINNLTERHIICPVIKSVFEVRLALFVRCFQQTSCQMECCGSDGFRCGQNSLLCYEFLFLSFSTKIIIWGKSPFLWDGWVSSGKSFRSLRVVNSLREKDLWSWWLLYHCVIKIKSNDVNVIFYDTH